MNIANQKVVSFHYTLTNNNGDKIDSSEGQEPLTYLHGSSSIIPGLEQALEGKTPGDKLQVTVEPKDGYGEVNPELVQVVPREAFQGVDKVEPGMQFEVGGQGGPTQPVTVQAVGEEGVTINGNHPLAGETLNFDVEISEVREATKEELEHGHAH